MPTELSFGVRAVCLTLANAATVLEHLNPDPPARGYTRTLHHAGYLSPGDLLRAVDDEYPRTAALVHRHQGRITVTDQYGATFGYSTGAVIATAVPDAFSLGREPRSRGVPFKASSVTRE